MSAFLVSAILVQASSDSGEAWYRAWEIEPFLAAGASRGGVVLVQGEAVPRHLRLTLFVLWDYGDGPLTRRW